MNSHSAGLTARLDQVAEWTRVPRLLRQVEDGPARPLRILPVLCLAAVVMGLWAQASGRWWGFGTIALCWSLTTIMHRVGPLRRSAARPDRDEREAKLVRRGHLVSLMICLALVVTACLYFGAGPLLPLLGLGAGWVPTHPLDWFSLALSLPVVELSLATLVASRRLPAPFPEDE